MRPQHLLLIPAVALLLACDSQKSQFVAACTAKDHGEKECTCVYDLAGEKLAPKDRDAFVTSVIKGDNLEAALKGGNVLDSLSTGLSLVAFAVAAADQCHIK